MCVSTSARGRECPERKRVHLFSSPPRVKKSEAKSNGMTKAAEMAKFSPRSMLVSSIPACLEARDVPEGRDASFLERDIGFGCGTSRSGKKVKKVSNMQMSQVESPGQ